MNLAVFDIDGTLVKYHRKRNDQAFVHAVKEMLGLTIEDGWSGFIHSTDSGIFSELIEKNMGRSCTVRDIGEFKKCMTVWLEKEYGADPFAGITGAQDCLKELSKDPHWALAIGTGNWEFSGRFKLQSAGINALEIPFASADDGVKRDWILQMAFSRAKKAVHANNCLCRGLGLGCPSGKGPRMEIHRYRHRGFGKNASASRGGTSLAGFCRDGSAAQQSLAGLTRDGGKLRADHSKGVIWNHAYW
jgi:beta-phosphoglucomutase-like phosphatase (HAD superfamily)